LTITTQFLTEPAAVFIQHNDLTRRFKALNSHALSEPSGSTTFRIAQTGFGDGRLFLALAQHWLEHAPAQAQLQRV
jgi:tRNA U34 5-methylaminomethyl-2-thiouridine-forming methyltransferase MnmC